MKALKHTVLFLGLAWACAGVALAKLPAPGDDAKAKAAEAAAKTAWSAKVEAYLLCKSQDKVAAHHAKTAKTAGKEVKPAPDLPPCADPGPFVYTPPAAPVGATTAVTAPAVNTSAPAPATTAAAASARKP